MISLLLAQTAVWSAPTTYCTLKSDQITESSGLAPSRRTPGSFYTHNDSGDRARFFRFSSDGAVTGEFELAGVTALDWEEMTSAKIRGKSYLYLADCGDNRSVRPQIQIHRVEEPSVQSGKLKPKTWALNYEDKAHDCEALFVEPGSQRLWVITKAWTGATHVFSTELVEGMSSAKLVKRGVLNLEAFPIGASRLVTGAALSSEGTKIVVRTYTHAAEYSISRASRFENWFSQTPAIFPLAKEKQGEAICYGKNQDELFTSTEGKDAPISRYQRKKSSRPGP